MNNANDASSREHIRHRNYGKEQRRSFFARTLLPFSISLSLSGFVIYMMQSIEGSILSPLETNILGVTIALISYKSLELWGQRRAAKKHSGHNLATQSHINDITTKADIITKNLIIDILGCCETLKDKQRSKANKEHVTSILKATSRLENYLKNALHTIQFHSQDTVKPPVTVLSFRDSIASTIERAVIYAQWHNMTLHYKISPEIPNKMDIDIQSFKIALHNTLLNAISSTQSDAIELSVESVNTNGINTYLRMAIRTNAALGKTDITIQSDDISHYITKSMVETSGGFIENSTTHNGVESRKCYNIYIPFIEHGDTPQDAKNHSIAQNILSPHLIGSHFKHKKAQIAAPKILIVDDHPANIMLLHKFIEHHDTKQIDEASNGQQAIRMYNIHHHQIIFMDCQMPNIDGFDASREIRAIEKRNGLAPSIIIGVTADTSRLARKKSHESGMNELIYKPVSRELLTHALSKHMEVNQDIALKEKSAQQQQSNMQPEDFTKTVEIKTTPSQPLIQASKEKDASQLPVNLKRLRACTEGDYEEEEVFFNLFLEQAKETLYVLEQTLKNHNVSDWTQAAHKLKGSSANLGAEQLAELCQIAEHHDSTIADEDILNAIKSELTKVDDFMHTILNEDLKNQTQNRRREQMH